MLDMKKASNRIYEIRKLKGLTQEGLADLMDVPQSQVQKLENGTRRLTTEWMAKLSKALNVPMAAFIIDTLNDEPETPVKNLTRSYTAKGFNGLGNINPLTGKLDLRDNRSRDGITMDKIDGSSVVVMPDGSMAPRYHDGQRLLVNPDYPIKAGSAVLLELKDGSGIVRELVSKSRDEWLLKTYTPLADETIPVTEIQKAWLVIAAFEI
jgi:transcriptional regulator with XRE-family HTH domain